MFIFCSPKDYLFISFACPKETNQRKGQPQIFFGTNKERTTNKKIIACFTIHSKPLPGENHIKCNLEHDNSVIFEQSDRIFTYFTFPNRGVKWRNAGSGQ